MGVGRRGQVRDGAQLTRALQLMQAEAGGGGPTKTEVRQGEVMVCVRPDQLGRGQRWARQGLLRGRVWVPAAPVRAPHPSRLL